MCGGLGALVYEMETELGRLSWEGGRECMWA